MAERRGSDRKCIVYGLMAMDAGLIRYAGQTTRTLRLRLSGHIDRARAGHRTPVHCWIRSVLDRGGEIGIVPIVEDAVLHETEIEVIARLRDEGYDLLNLTDGGEGTPGWVMSEGQRQQASERMRRRYEDPAAREISAVHLREVTSDPEWRRQHGQRIADLWSDGVWRAHMMLVRAATWTAERRANRAEMLRLLWQDASYRDAQMVRRREIGARPEFVEKMTTINREINSRPEVRAKHSEKSGAYWSQPEARAAQSARLKGIPKSEAARASYREAAKRRPPREFTDEERQKLADLASKQWKGTKKSEEHKRKIAESNRRTKALRKAEREAAAREQQAFERQMSLSMQPDLDRKSETIRTSPRVQAIQLDLFSGV